MGGVSEAEAQASTGKPRRAAAQCRSTGPKGRILLAASVMLLAGLSASTPLLSEKCSLAGTYDAASSTCTCLEAWRGDKCSILDLEPAHSAESIVAWSPAGRNSWGGSVVEHGGGYHMFAAVMAGTMSLDAGWTANSTIEHLFSTSPQGPFTPYTPLNGSSSYNPIKVREAHNPSMGYDAKNKRWCLYYIGRSPIDGLPVTPAYWSGIADIAVTCASSIDGPWQGAGTHNGPFPLVNHQVAPQRWDNWIQNPEPVFDPADGSVTLILNSNMHDNTLPIGTDFSTRAISAATAPDAFGPFTMSEGPIYKPPGFGPEVGAWIGNEDPGVFQQCSPANKSDCAWHILTHQFGPGAPGDSSGVADPNACNGHAVARSLSTKKEAWTWVDTAAYNKTVPLRGSQGETSSSSKVLELGRRERPHVFMEGGVPRYLYNGAAWRNGTTFTMVTKTVKRG